MFDKEKEKAVKTYTSMFRDAMKRQNIPEYERIIKLYSEKLIEMYQSKQFEEHDIYPTIDTRKNYAVIAISLILREEHYCDEEIIELVNFAFRKPKQVVKILIKIIDSMPWAYKIAEKWNLNDHKRRVQDGSVIYDVFQVDEGRIEYSIQKCMYAEMFDCYGIRELCKIFCMTDTQAYEGLTRHVVFTRYSDLSDGCVCHDVIERK